MERHPILLPFFYLSSTGWKSINLIVIFGFQSPCCSTFNALWTILQKKKSDWAMVVKKRRSSHISSHLHVKRFVCWSVSPTICHSVPLGVGQSDQNASLFLTQMFVLAISQPLQIGFWWYKQQNWSTQLNQSNFTRLYWWKLNQLNYIGIFWTILEFNSIPNFIWPCFTIVKYTKLCLIWLGYVKLYWPVNLVNQIN